MRERRRRDQDDRGDATGRRRSAPLEPEREDARNRVYLTRVEKLEGAATALPLVATAPLVSVAGRTFQELPLSWLAIGTVVWVLITVYPIAELNVRQRDLLRQRRRAARDAHRPARPAALPPAGG